MREGEREPCGGKAERLESIIYLALWELRELDPASEPEHFRLTRSELHRRIDGGGAQPLPPSAQANRHLRLIP